VSAADLATQLDIHLITAQRWLRGLKAEGVIHVVQWLPDSLGRDATPVYALGSNEDLPRKKQLRSEIMQRYRERHAKPVESVETF
jgi:predicted ArsR family transcriptional regulator